MPHRPATARVSSSHLRGRNSLLIERTRGLSVAGARALLKEMNDLHEWDSL